MEEMLPWGDVWNVDCKLKRESESSANFFYSLLFHLKITRKKKSLSLKVDSFAFKGKKQFQILVSLSFHCEVSGKKDLKVEL